MKDLGELGNAKIMDWVEGLGDIGTYAELKFIHRFGKWFKEKLRKEKDDE